MVKKEAINALIDEKVVPILTQELDKQGFKYKKSNKHFIRGAKDGIAHILNLYPNNSPLVYDEDTEQIFLNFTISAFVDFPAYKKWHIDTFGQRDFTSIDYKRIVCQIELSLDDFTKDHFYSPTPTQRFKMVVQSSLISARNVNEQVVPMAQALQVEIPEFIAYFHDKTDILTLYNNPNFPYVNSLMLLFAGYTDLAKQQIKTGVQNDIETLEKMLKNDSKEAADKLKFFEDYLLKVNKVTDLALENPFIQSFKVLPSKQDEFVFSSKTKFSELLRLDLSQHVSKRSSIDIKMNGLGEVLILANKKIFKLNLQGEVIFEKQYEFDAGFDNTWSLPSGVIEGSNDFFVNNWVIKGNNEVLNLVLPKKKLKKGKLQPLNIRAIAFWEKESKYLILYEQQLLIYNDQGVLEQSKEIDTYYGAQFIMSKEWIVFSNRQNNTHHIKTFDGETLGKYDFSNGNHKYAYSKNHEYLICFNYAITSQLYKLPSGKKETLKAHPTHINGYKEVGYPDTEHNFGLDIAKFSPDSTYIVGCAYHGRYVAWKLPKLERVDLVPQAEMINLLTPRESLKSVGDGFEKVIIKPSFFSAGGQSFLKNFNFNEISNIFFFENGDIFITEIGRGKFVLTWDRDFNNLNFRKLEGILNLFAEKYLTQTTETELIIYELQS